MNLNHEIRCEYARLVTRRWFFRQCGVGLGSIALASLFAFGNVGVFDGTGHRIALSEKRQCADGVGGSHYRARPWNVSK